jgi:hypothetical protein
MTQPPLPAPTVTNVRNSFCTLVCTSFFTLVRSIWLREKQVEISDSESAGKKITKTGGSDPTFSASSRPKSRWGRSRPPRAARGRVWAACRNRIKHFVMQVVMHHELRKEEKHLALLKAPSKQPKTTTLQVRLEEEVRHNLDKYAEFIDANASYVVSEALKFLFRKDEEFKRWVGQQTNNRDQEQIQGDALIKTV